MMKQGERKTAIRQTSKQEHRSAVLGITRLLANSCLPDVRSNASKLNMFSWSSANNMI
jgi:hypothetical protein